MMPVITSALVILLLLQCPQLKCYRQYGRNIGSPSYSYHRSWTTWSSWSHCSRSCGSGITMRTRLCRRRTADWSSEKSGFCPGETTEYRVCNAKVCPKDGTIDFRHYQCSLYNNRVTVGRYVREWIPYEKGDNRCELKCREKGSHRYYSFGKVSDGTECSLRAESRDICVNGRCLAVGCDGKVGSGAHLDICGVCGGRNGSCTYYRNVYLKQPTEPGYQEIAVVPAGSTHLEIRDVSYRNNLALMDSKFQYVINGPGMVSHPGEYHVTGTVVTYSRLSGNVETISASGPTTQQLHVVAVLRDRNPGIYYEYWTPRDKYYYAASNPPDLKRSSISMIDSNQFRRTPSDVQLVGRSVYRNNTKWNAVIRDTVPDETTNRLTYHKYHVDNQPDRYWNDVSIRILSKSPQNEPLATNPAPNNTDCILCNSRLLKEKKSSRRKKASDGCPVCGRVKNVARHFCKSDFVIRAVVTDKEKVRGKWRYVVELIQSFKNKVPMLSREYIWTRGKCQCPKLRLGEEYIVMGYSDHSRRENRLLIDRKCYSRRYKRSKSIQLLRLRRNGCAKVI